MGGLDDCLKVVQAIDRVVGKELWERGALDGDVHGVRRDFIVVLLGDIGTGHSIDSRQEGSCREGEEMCHYAC